MVENDSKEGKAVAVWCWDAWGAMSVTEQAGKAANSVSSEKDWENPASHEEELQMPSITQQSGEESSKGSSEKNE